MTDRPKTLSPQISVLSQTQTIPTLPPGPVAKDEVEHKVETVEEEPYTIKCICNFSDDDGNTIYCETCDTWQHIECFYPDNREEAIREDFAHSCAECKPRPLNRQKAVERALQLRTNSLLEAPSEKKGKRPPSKGHKKKPKSADGQTNGVSDNGDLAPPPKKPKTSHRPSQSISSQSAKRSPSYSNARSNPAHPPSPATSPPDLPNDFPIHHYSEGFFALYNDDNVTDIQNNTFTGLGVPTTFGKWIREPEYFKQDTGRSLSEVFVTDTSTPETERPKLEIKEATRTLDSGMTGRWRYLKSTHSIEEGVQMIELNGDIGFQHEYCSNSDSRWGLLSSPLPFVFFLPNLPLYIDTRTEGSAARYVRRSCKPNAQLENYLSNGSEFHFWLVSDRRIAVDEQITLPWDFRLPPKSAGPRWLQLLGLCDDDAPTDTEPEIDDGEYEAICNWIDLVLSEYGGCACELGNNCAFARFHRNYRHGKTQQRANGNKKKQRKPRPHAVSPTSTGHASRAASEGHVDDGVDHDGRSQSGSSRSKPSSRDPTPIRQGSFDQLGILTEPTDRDKRKVQMVEDSFRRMEQQQQPPKKKKRVSDGTASSRSKQRTGSMSQGTYVDSGTGGSKSGSPTSAQSPTFPSTFKGASRRQSTIVQSRQSSMNPRPVYCDACVQTDPVEGEWFSTPTTPSKPRKVISLAKRLLESRQKQREAEAKCRQQPLTPRTSSGSAMEVDSPTGSKHTAPLDNEDIKSPLVTSQSEDAAMPDALPDVNVTPATAKTPDLRVQMPPVPSFDNTVLGTPSATTPLSVTSSTAQSPFASTNLPIPLGSSIVNGASNQPSPAKKKLSLSDYTRRSKQAGKVAGGSAVLKATLPSPEESKVDVVLGTLPVVKTEDRVVS